MKYKDLIEQMTLEEKASLLSGKNFWNTKSIERLGIPSMMLTDGPHGLRKQAGKEDHLGLHKSVPATCYPTAAGLANSWDEELLEEMGEALGLEAASEGVSVLLGPGCNIKRNPKCGRNFEYFSEDPYLSGKMAAAMIRGIQKNGISACVKHFAVNSQEHMRMTNDSIIDERTLREIYLPAFEIAVREGKTKCLMTSYNLLNGTYTNENTHLLQDILTNDWGYDGLIVTDWGGCNDRVKGLVAGNHLEMPSTNGQTDRDVVNAVREGIISEELVDERVDKILDMVFSTRDAIKDKTYDKKEHHHKAKKIAEEAVVLLKNEDNVLPIKKNQSVAVIGDFAHRPRIQGSGSSKVNPTKVSCVYESLERLGVDLIGYEKGFSRTGREDETLLHRACELATLADKVLLFLGLNNGGEGEGIDRKDILLPKNQQKLLKALQLVNKNIIVILTCGCVVDMSWDKNIKGIIHGYLAGQAGGRAIAEILVGKVNPSGKLAETIPVKYHDLPNCYYYPGMERTSEYREAIYVGYRYFDTVRAKVKYPFGYGLSYTTFEYSDLTVNENVVTFKVKNTGKRPGREVAQLYVAAHTKGMFRPAKELKGFASVMLEPGEEKEVSLMLDDRSFSVWSVIENDWIIEPGRYEILIGASSRDIRLKAEVVKEGEPHKNPYKYDEFEEYYTGLVRGIEDDMFEDLLDREIPRAHWSLKDHLSFNGTIAQAKHLKGGAGKVLYHGVDGMQKGLRAIKQDEMANNLNCVKNMPYRGIARMSGFLNEKIVRKVFCIHDEDESDE